MKKLGKKLNISGIGLPGLTAKLIKRKKNVAIYLRDDGLYEVGIIKISPAAKLFGKEYPEREIYFSNEDFGSTAFTTTIKEKAEKYFDKFLKKKRK